MAAQRPNIVLILNDDMGYSDLGCYGGEIDTPNLDRLARGGLRYAQFYNTARCCPSRASLLTGLHPHQAGVGDMAGTNGPDGYEGTLNNRCVTLAEVLQSAGYCTYMSGKWHVVSDTTIPNDAWPCQRGFDQFWGIITGAASYFRPRTLTRNNANIDYEAEQDPDFYLTDAITDNAVEYIRSHFQDHTGDPFFMYVAYTAPHWPLHARQEDIAKYRGRFDKGWDVLRNERLQRMADMGLIDPDTVLSPRDPGQPAWEDEPNKEWQALRMEVYAAQIDCMDQGIGRILEALEEQGVAENTLVIFLADNGGCHEEIVEGWWKWMLRAKVAHEQTKDGRTVRVGNSPEIIPGAEDTYCSYGVPWANLSNTPFRMYKHWVHEGGISTPLIINWPDGIAARGELRHDAGQLPDIMATILDAAGAEYPLEYPGRDLLPHEGTSLAPTFVGEPLPQRLLYWEHEGNAAIREGRWKLVKNFTGQLSATPGYDDSPEQRGDWELYDISTDRTELNDLASANPELLNSMKQAYQEWADRVGVIEWEEFREIMGERRD